MAVIKEWECLEHGYFEGSHPICPNSGCDSSTVDRAFLTPPGIRSSFMKNFDAGIRQTADGLNQTNFHSAARGEIAHTRPNQGQVLWGAQGEALLGKSLTQVERPTFQIADDQGRPRQWTDRGGLKIVANETPLLNKTLPNAEVSAVRGDESFRQ